MATLVFSVSPPFQQQAQQKGGSGRAAPATRFICKVPPSSWFFGLAPAWSASGALVAFRLSRDSEGPPSAPLRLSTGVCGSRRRSVASCKFQISLGDHERPPDLRESAYSCNCVLRPSDRSGGAAEIPYLHRLWTPPPPLTALFQHTWTHFT